MDVADEELIDSETVKRSLGEWMVGRHSVINWKDWNLQLFGPFSGVNLHGPTRKSDESSSMHVKNHILDVLDLFVLPQAAAWSFHLGEFLNFLIMQKPNHNGIRPFLKDIKIVFVFPISWNVKFYIGFDAIVSDLWELFSCSKLRKVP